MRSDEGDLHSKSWMPLRSFISPLLVGRDDLLELATGRLDEAAEGRGQLLLIAGEAGIGKSRW